MSDSHVALAVASLLATAGCSFEGGNTSPNAGLRDGAAADAAPLPDARRVDAAGLVDADASPGDDTLLALPADPIVFDGQLGEWGDAAWVNISAPEDFVADEGTAADGDDLSARIAARYTSDTLYLAFEVRDEAHTNDFTDADIWRHDSVQIAFDVAHDGGLAYDDANDWEYGWAIIDGESAVTSYRWHAPATAPTYAAAAFFLWRDGDTTTYELAIPASHLGLATLPVGLELGFAAVVNDCDGDTRGRAGYIEWQSGIGPGKVPELFGTLALSE